MTLGLVVNPCPFALCSLVIGHWVHELDVSFNFNTIEEQRDLPNLAYPPQTSSRALDSEWPSTRSS